MTVEERLAALEERLGELEDEREIRELLSRYGHFADACLDDEYYDLFVAEGAMEVSQGGTDDPYKIVEWVGRDAMRDFMRERTALHGNGFAGRSLHMQGNNLAVTVAGDTATAQNYSFILHQDGPQIVLVSASINHWELTRADGAWRIVRRRRRMVGSPDTAEILTGTAT